MFDRKNRIVLPVSVREKLGLTNSVVLKIDNNKVSLRKPNGEIGSLISKNISEIKNGNSSVTVSIQDCGSCGAGSTPAYCPQESKILGASRKTFRASPNKGEKND